MKLQTTFTRRDWQSFSSFDLVENRSFRRGNHAATGKRIRIRSDGVTHTGPDKFTMNFTAGTGLFAGSFFNSITSATRLFKGVVFQ